MEEKRINLILITSTMKFLNNIIKNERLIFFIVILFFVSKLFILLSENNVWWDSAVYVGMGKYIFSFGNSGLWEASRPLVWPLILGFFLKLGANISFLRTIELFFAAGSIYLTYLVARNIFNSKVALYSSLFLAFSPTFYFFSSKLLSGIPSLFFALFGIYLFLNKKYFLSGLLLGIAFMTRFLQIFVFIVLFLNLLFCLKRKKDMLRNLMKLSLGFSIVLIPYFILNFILYGNPLHPFILQNFLSNNTGSIYHQPLWFYIINLLKENLLISISIIGLYYLIKNTFSYKNYKKSSLLIIFLSFFIFYTAINHKEIRFMILLFPYLYIITAYSLNLIIEKINLKKSLYYSFLVMIFSIWFLQSFSQIYVLESDEIQQENKHTIFQNFFEKDNLGNIWISNPIFALFSDKKIDELIYYPTLNAEKFNILKNKLNVADSILIDTCDLVCEPKATSCNSEKIQFLKLIKNNLNTVYSEKVDGCERIIFRK